jgi:hypothetical protein
VDGVRSAAPVSLRAYAKLYADVFRDDRMCLCGMLAADYPTLPEPMRERVVRFFDDNEVWLSRILEDGRKAGTITCNVPAPGRTDADRRTRRRDAGREALSRPQVVPRCGGALIGGLEVKR